MLSLLGKIFFVYKHIHTYDTHTHLRMLSFRLHVLQALVLYCIAVQFILLFRVVVNCIAPMRLCMYVCMCIDVYVPTCVCMCIYIYMYGGVCVCVRVCKPSVAPSQAPDIHASRPFKRSGAVKLVFKMLVGFAKVHYG